MKKVAICLPHNIENTGKREGFLSQEETAKVEELLTLSPEIDFLGNLDLGQLQIVDNLFICQGVVLNDLDIFFNYSPKTRKYLDELKALSKITKVLKSPDSYETVADKFLSHSLLKKNGLPVSEFALLDYADTASMERIMREWKTVLVKPRLGNFGGGIIKVGDFETLRDIAGLLAEHKVKKIFLEKYYENSLEDWISSTLVGGKVIYGYRKKAKKYAGWKVFDIGKSGGSAYYVDPEPIREIAEKAASVLDKSIVGFDFIKTEEGYKIVDENNFPGFYKEAFEDSGNDLAKLIFDLIVSNIK